MNIYLGTMYSDSDGKFSGFYEFFQNQNHIKNFDNFLKNIIIYVNTPNEIVIYLKR